MENYCFFYNTNHILLGIFPIESNMNKNKIFFHCIEYHVFFIGKDLFYSFIFFLLLIADVTTFFNNMIRVIGPIPPGTGVT